MCGRMLRSRWYVGHVFDLNAVRDYPGSCWGVMRRFCAGVQFSERRGVCENGSVEEGPWQMFA